MERAAYFCAPAQPSHQSRNGDAGQSFQPARPEHGGRTKGSQEAEESKTVLLEEARARSGQCTEDGGSIRTATCLAHGREREGSTRQESGGQEREKEQMMTEPCTTAQHCLSLLSTGCSYTVSKHSNSTRSQFTLGLLVYWLSAYRLSTTHFDRLPSTVWLRSGQQGRLATTCASIIKPCGWHIVLANAERPAVQPQIVLPL